MYHFSVHSYTCTYMHKSYACTDLIIIFNSNIQFNPLECVYIYMGNIVFCRIKIFYINSVFIADIDWVFRFYVQERGGENINLCIIYLSKKILVLLYRFIVQYMQT